MEAAVLKPPYPDKFKPGDTVISKKDVVFTDGTRHEIGQKVKVTDRTVAYYNVFHNDYEKS